MVDKLKDVLMCRDIVVPRLLFNNYRKLGLSSDNLIFLIYILNSNLIFNPKQISEDIGMSLSEVMECIESMSSSGLLKVEIRKNGNVRNEFINIDGLFDKLSNLLISDEKEETSNIYDVFESEFGRTISPMEYEIINAWLDNNVSEEVIILALKEAVYNGVNNLRYIDKIISEWTKKGIKNAEDVEKSRIKYKKERKKTSDEILNYDWLNDE